MNNLSRLTQDVLHARNELAYAKEIVDKLGTDPHPDAGFHITRMITCEFALDDAVKAFKAEEARLLKEVQK